jgi:hypothetical protein
VIPDFPGPPALAVIPVSGLTDTLSAVKVKFPGTECSTDPVDTVGIQHSYVSDLKVTIFPPPSMIGAQPIVVMDRPGTDNPGNNFCDTLLDDAAANSIQDILAGENPFNGSYAPANPLAPYANRPASQANGDWAVQVEDLAGQDGGVLWRVSLQFYTRQNGRTCDPPRVCEPDFNQDGNVDQADVDYLLNVIGGGENPTGIDPDFNRDGNADQTDVATFIGVVAGEPCP